jgi:hypothetical protein
LDNGELEIPAPIKSVEVIEAAGMTYMIELSDPG